MKNVKLIIKENFPGLIGNLRAKLANYSEMASAMLKSFYIILIIFSAVIVCSSKQTDFDRFSIVNFIKN